MWLLSGTQVPPKRYAEAYRRFWKAVRPWRPLDSGLQHVSCQSYPMTTGGAVGTTQNINGMDPPMHEDESSYVQQPDLGGLPKASQPTHP